MDRPLGRVILRYRVLIQQLRFCSIVTLTTLTAARRLLPLRQRAREHDSRAIEGYVRPSCVLRERSADTCPTLPDDQKQIVAQYRKWASLNAFVSQIDQAGFLRILPFAFWAMAEAFEGDEAPSAAAEACIPGQKVDEDVSEMLACEVAVAAQWMRRHSRKMYRHFRSPEDSNIDARGIAVLARFRSAEMALSVDRWSHWRAQFELAHDWDIPESVKRKAARVGEGYGSGDFGAACLAALLVLSRVRTPGPRIRHTRCRQSSSCTSQTALTHISEQCLGSGSTLLPC